MSCQVEGRLEYRENRKDLRLYNVESMHGYVGSSHGYANT